MIKGIKYISTDQNILITRFTVTVLELSVKSHDLPQQMVRLFQQLF